MWALQNNSKYQQDNLAMVVIFIGSDEEIHHFQYSHPLLGFNINREDLSIHS